MIDGFKSCPREGASEVAKEQEHQIKVSSHAPVRGHLEVNGQPIIVDLKFQVMPP